MVSSVWDEAEAGLKSKFPNTGLKSLDAPSDVWDEAESALTQESESQAFEQARAGSSSPESVMWQNPPSQDVWGQAEMEMQAGEMPLAPTPLFSPKGVSTIGLTHPEQQKAGEALRDAQLIKETEGVRQRRLTDISKAMEANPDFFQGMTPEDVLKREAEAQKAGMMGDVEVPFVDPMFAATGGVGAGIPALAKYGIKTLPSLISGTIAATAVDVPVGQMADDLASSDFGRRYPYVPLAFNMLLGTAGTIGAQKLLNQGMYATATAVKKNQIDKLKGDIADKLAPELGDMEAVNIAERGINKVVDGAGGMDFVSVQDILKARNAVKGTKAVAGKVKGLITETPEPVNVTPEQSMDMAVKEMPQTLQTMFGSRKVHYMNQGMAEVAAVNKAFTDVSNTQLGQMILDRLNTDKVEAMRQAEISAVQEAQSLEQSEALRQAEQEAVVRPESSMAAVEEIAPVQPQGMPKPVSAMTDAEIQKPQPVISKKEVMPDAVQEQAQGQEVNLKQAEAAKKQMPLEQQPKESVEQANDLAEIEAKKRDYRVTMLLRKSNEAEIAWLDKKEALQEEYGRDPKYWPADEKKELAELDAENNRAGEEYLKTQEGYSSEPETPEAPKKSIADIRKEKFLKATSVITPSKSVGGPEQGAVTPAPAIGGIPIKEGGMSLESRAALLERTGQKEAAAKLRLTAEKKVSLPKTPEKTSLIGWINSKGGVDIGNLKGEFRIIMEDNPRAKFLKRKGGKWDVDQLANMAMDEGLIKDNNPQTLMDAIADKKWKSPAQQEAAAAEATKNIINPFELSEGQKIIIKGETFTKKGDILEDGVDIPIDPFSDYIKVDKVFPPPKPKTKAVQKDMFGATRGGLEGPLTAKETPETELEKSIRESQARDIEAEEAKRQGDITLEAGGFQTIYENAQKITEETGEIIGEIPAGSLAFGQELPKYAGGKTSINLERIDTSYAVRKTINDIADAYNQQKAKRTWNEIQTEADSIGLNIKDAIKDKPKNISQEAWVQAKRDVLADSATRLRALQESYAGKVLTESDMTEIRLIMNQHAGIQAEALGLASEAGRTLNIHRKLSKAKGTIEGYKQILDALGGKELNKEIVDKFLSLDPNNPLAIAKFVREASRAKTKDMIYEAWINALLSNPPTHVANLIGNTLTILSKPLLETPMIATIEAGKSLLTGKLRERFYGEIPKEIKGALQPFGRAGKTAVNEFIKSKQFGVWQGFKEGVRAGLKSFEQELPADIVLAGKIEQVQQQAIPGKLGSVIRVPGTLLKAMDNVFKTIVYSSELNTEAYRIAMREGLKGSAKAERIADRINNPTDAMKSIAGKESLYRTFNNPNAIASWIMKGKTLPIIGTPLQYIIPFVRTPANIAAFTLGRTPLALPWALKKTGVARREALAKIGVGTIIGIITMQYVLEGFITGGGPKDNREALYRTGWQPYSFRIGGKYYSYLRLEPLGSIIGMATDMKELIDEGMKEKTINELAAQIALAFTKNVTSKTFMSGVVNMLNAISDPARYGERWINQLTGSVVPAGVGGVARENDPVIRRIETPLDVIKSRIPIVSESLLPKRDLWGKPTEREPNGFISPITISTAKMSKVDNEIVRLKLNIGMPDKTIKGVGLTLEEHDRYIGLAGKPAKKWLDAGVNSSSWEKIDDEAKARIIKKTIKAFRQEAAKKIYGDIDRKRKIEGIKKTQVLTESGRERIK